MSFRDSAGDSHDHPHHPHVGEAGDSKPVERMLPQQSSSSKNPLASFLKKGSKKVNLTKTSMASGEDVGKDALPSSLPSGKVVGGLMTLDRRDHEYHDPSLPASSSFFASAVTLPRRGPLPEPPAPSRGNSHDSTDYPPPRPSLEGDRISFNSDPSHDSFISSRSLTLPHASSSTPVMAVPISSSSSAASNASTTKAFGTIFSKMTRKANTLIRRQRSLDGATEASLASSFAVPTPPEKPPTPEPQPSKWKALADSDEHFQRQPYILAPAAETLHLPDPEPLPLSPRQRRRARKSRIVSYASSAGSDEGGHVTRTDVYRNRTSMASLFTVDGGSSEDDVEELDAVAEEDEEEDEFETRDNVEITNETVGPALGPQSPTAEHSAPREWRSSPSAEPATPISRHRRFADGFDSDEDVVEAEDEDDDDRVLGEGVDLTATRRLLLDAYGSDDVRAPVEKQMDGSPPILPLKEDVDFFGDAPRLSLGGSTFVESPKPLDRSASPSKLGESVRFKIGDVMSLDRSRGKKGAKSPEPDLKTVRFAETLPSNGAAPSLKLRSLLQRSNSTSSPSRSASTSSTIPTTSPPTVPSNTTSWAKGLGGLFDRASTNEKKEGWNRVKKKGSIDSRLGTVRGVDVERSTTIASTYKSESDGVGLLFSSETTKAEDDFKLFGDDELVALGIGLPRTSTDSNQKDPWTQAWLVEDKSSDHASSDRRNSTNSTDSSIPPPLPPRRRSVISLASSPPLPLPPQEESALPPLPPPSPPPPSIRSISSTSTGGLTPWAKGTVHPDDTPEPAKTKLDHLLETLMEDIDTEIDRHAEISRVDHAERAPRDGIPRSQSTGSSIGSDATMVRSVMSRSVTGLSEVEDEKRNILSRSATGLSEAEDEKRRDSISIPSRMSVLPGAVGFEDMLAKLESVYMGAK